MPQATERPTQPTTHLSVAPAAIEDFYRLEEFLLDRDDPLAGGLVAFVMQALAVLKTQPGIGRPVGAGFRELIISRGHTGYLARYQFQPAVNLVTVLRIRHQRESGYTEEEV